MAYIYVEQETEKVLAIYYGGINELPDNIKKDLKTVGYIPELESLFGKYGEYYYDFETGVVSVKYFDRPLTPEEEIQLLKEENENLRLEMARSNTELFEMMVAMTGGIA